MVDSSLSHEMMRSEGERLLRSGRVAIAMAAGGISSRMKGGTFRGQIPVGPITGKTLFRLQGEKVLALREFYNANLPWIVVTSLQSNGPTLETFRNEGLDGVAEFVQQDSLAALDIGSKPYRQASGEPIHAPTGHGGIFATLAREGAIERLMIRGVTDLFLFQFPNVLEKLCDPLMLGFHSLYHHDMTLKGFRCLSRVPKELDASFGRIESRSRNIMIRCRTRLTT